MSLTLLRISAYTAISAILSIRVLFFILNVHLGESDGYESLRIFFCASITFILLSRIYLYLINKQYQVYQKVKTPIHVISVTLITITLLLMMAFIVMKGPTYFQTLTPAEWLKFLFWSG